MTTRVLDGRSPQTHNDFASRLVRRSDVPVAAAPLSFEDSTFTRYRHREGVLALSCAAAAYLLAPTAMLMGMAAGGPVGAMLSTLLGVGAAAWVLDQTGMLGNFRMRQELAERLGMANTTDEFVGIGLPENNTFINKYLRPRLDSDDNVGFLRIRGEQLRLTMEEGTLVIDRDEIRRITTERLVELPYLRWIRVEYYKDDALQAVLVSSRMAETLWELRGATTDLNQRLVTWWTEPVMRELMAGNG